MFARIVLVNRGWVPRSAIDKGDVRVNACEGEVTTTGVLREGEKVGMCMNTACMSTFA